MNSERSNDPEGLVEPVVVHSSTDVATGLPNRILFKKYMQEVLTHTSASSPLLALLLINLDGFRSVNDMYGQSAGDFVLRTIANRLVGLGPFEILARIGSDEFAVVCRTAVESTAMSALADRINAAICEPVDYLPDRFTVTASVGIALSHNGTETLDDFMRYATAAVQSARLKGTGTWDFFDEPAHIMALKRAAIAKGLLTAAENNELSCRFQPIVGADTGHILGAELLLRWFPASGEISPSEFIPVAEATGSILAIGTWVFTQACLAERDWHERWGSLAPYVSVNVSVSQLNNSRLAEEFGKILAQSGADSSRILLEITESTLMSDIDAKLSVLHGLANLGLRVAIDDFGTGYSSLAQLTRLPVDVLKIDRAFIEGIEKRGESRTVVQAIIGLGRALGLKLVAEGVENRQQQLELCGYGCDFIQGFYFHRPLEATVFVETVEREIAVDAPAKASTLHFLIYVSKAVRPILPEELDQLLKATRVNNTAIGVTGCLIYQDGFFMQMLEGERDAVVRVYEHVKESALHTEVKIVIEGKARRRIFTHFSMLLRDNFASIHEPDYSGWQMRVINFQEMAHDARTCYAYITAYVPDIKQ